MARTTKKERFISLESTTYPGTTQELISEPLRQNGFVVGKDIFVCYSPEREDPANETYKTNTIPKIVSGETAACLQIGVELYSQAVKVVVQAQTTKVAEMAKLLENIYRCINISLINEMKMIADKMDINILDVIDAAKTKPFGFTPYYPGPGIGGHCIPVDPFYLTWKAKEFGIHSNFIELAGELNFKTQEYVVSKVIYALNTIKLSVKDSKILILGVAYKKNVGDVRESPAINIINMLLDMGADLSYHDPFVPKVDKAYHINISMQNSELTEELIQKHNLVLLLADHFDVDYKMILRNAGLIVDTRGVYRDIDNSKIIS